MTMMIRNYLLTAICSLLPLTSFAQEADRTEEYRQALLLKENIKKKRQALLMSVKMMNDSLKHLRAQSKSLEKAIRTEEKAVTKARKDMKDSEVPALRQQYAQLQKQLADQVEQQTATYNKLQQVTDSLHHLIHQQRELETLRDEFSQMFIADHQPYLDKPFSEMTADELRLIKTKCQPLLVDKSLVPFDKKIDITIANRQYYEEMAKAVNQPYQQQQVANALTLISNIQEASAPQQQEISNLRQQLQDYPDGLAAFKEYIRGVNSVREGVDNYTLEYFKTDEKSFLTDALKQRIDQKLMAIPYLKQRYEAFMKAFRENPNTHSVIESEILNL